MQYQRSIDGKQQYGMNLWDRSEKIILPKLIRITDSQKTKGFSNDEITTMLKEIDNGKPIVSSRMFSGKNFDNQVGVFLKDEFGNDRIKIYVDENNEPKIEILNNKGKISKTIQN